MKLIDACINASKNDIKDILTYSNVNYQEYGQTPLMIAAYHGRYDIVELLLLHGADCTITDKHNHSAVDYALWNGHVKITHLLKGINVGVCQ